MHEKAAYDRESIDAILDAMPVAHVGYVLDGAPVVTPTLQWREGETRPGGCRLVPQHELHTARAESAVPVVEEHRTGIR